MAVSACARCQNQSFEMQEAQIAGSRHKLSFVQCAACGAPAGVVDGQAASVLQEQDLRLREMQRHLETLESSLTHIRHVVGALANQRAI